MVGSTSIPSVRHHPSAIYFCFLPRHFLPAHQKCLFSQGVETLLSCAEAPLCASECCGSAVPRFDPRLGMGKEAKTPVSSQEGLCPRYAASDPHGKKSLSIPIKALMMLTPLPWGPQLHTWSMGQEFHFSLVLGLESLPSYVAGVLLSSPISCVYLGPVFPILFLAPSPAAPAWTP